MLFHREMTVTYIQNVEHMVHTSPSTQIYFYHFIFLAKICRLAELVLDPVFLRFASVPEPKHFEMDPDPDPYLNQMTTRKLIKVHK